MPGGRQDRSRRAGTIRGGRKDRLMPSPPATVAEVITRMAAILDPLTDSDGVACFTRLYLRVTEGVQARLEGLNFADPAIPGRPRRSLRQPVLRCPRCRIQVSAQRGAALPAGNGRRGDHPDGGDPRSAHQLRRCCLLHPALSPGHRGCSGTAGGPQLRRSAIPGRPRRSLRQPLLRRARHRIRV